MTGEEKKAVHEFLRVTADWAAGYASPLFAEKIEFTDDREFFPENSAEKNNFSGNSAEKNNFSENSAEKNQFGENFAEENRFSENSAEKNNFSENFAQENNFSENSAEQNRFCGNSAEKNQFSGNSAGKNNFSGNSAQQNNFSGNSAQQNRFGGNSAQQNHFGENFAEENQFSGNSAQQNNFSENSAEKNQFGENFAQQNQFSGNSAEQNRFCGNSAEKNQFSENSAGKNNFSGNSAQQNNFSGKSAEKNRFGGNSAENGGMTLAKLAEKISGCKNCVLCRTRKSAVPGEGVESPVVLVVGEGPGEEEDASGRPFVGKAGQLLDKMLSSISLGRTSNCYIANIVKCRPPMNRTPMKDEISACMGFLQCQINILNPRFILSLGRTSAQSLLKTSDGIAAIRGKWFDYEFGSRKIPLLATYHPSALLRDELLKRPAWEDLKSFKNRVAAEIPRYAEKFFENANRTQIH
jgi:DNA polymerase